MKRILKLLLVAIGLIMFVPSFTSCKDKEKEEESEYAKSSIVGTWKYTDDEEYDIYQFNADGTFISTTYIYDKGDYVTGTDIGTYAINGSTIVLYWTDYNETDKINFLLSGNVLYLGDYPYYRQ